MIEQREHSPNLPERKYAHWKSAVGLPGSFPQLWPLESDELDPEKVTTLQNGELDTTAPKLHFAVPHWEALQHAFLLTPSRESFIFFEQGQGVTTVAKYIYKVFNKEKLAFNKHPVLVSIDDVASSEDSLKALSEAVRIQVIQSFASDHWDYILGDKRYAGVLGVILPSEPTLFDGSKVSTPAFREEVEKLYALPKLIIKSAISQKIPLDELKEPPPVLGMPMEMLMRISFNNLTRIALVLDTSSQTTNNGSYDNALNDFLGAVDSFTEQYGKEHFCTTYLGYQDKLAKLRGPRKLSTAFPRYTSADIFAMLSRRYQPRDGALATVVDPSLIRSSGQPINQTVQEFDKRLMEKLSQSNDIPYRINK